MKYVWIKTQDGSPTLWNNDIGEPFRSVKGAFQESDIIEVISVTGAVDLLKQKK